MQSAAIALGRFGLGAARDEAPPADAREWLLAQPARFRPRTEAWAAQRGTEALLADYFERQRMVREESPADRAANRRAFGLLVRGVQGGAIGARVEAALRPEAPFVERLVHFWANHFAVSIDKSSVALLAGAFEAEAIRPHVLGRFEDMLAAVAAHPGMLLYLDQAASIGPGSTAGRRVAERSPERRRGLNENLAREILELHTLGVRSGYTQDDVTEFARALTGWTVRDPATVRRVSPNAPPAVLGFQFLPEVHEPGARRVLGRAYAEGGQEQARAILRDLARSPATARHVARKLARHFVADEPPAAVVQRLERAFLHGEGDLPAVYAALVESPEAWRPEPAKFKTPSDWALSSLRALGVREVEGQVFAEWMRQLGQPVWRPGSPAGFDDVAATWAAPDALVRRLEVAQRLAANAGAGIDARELAPRVVPHAGPATLGAIGRADTPATGLALLLVSPEFLRR